MLALYTKTVEEKKSWAQNDLGLYHFFGSEEINDEKKAVELLLKAAESGIVSAQDFLAYCYLYGRGIERDEKKAFEWYIKAADQGNVYAQKTLNSVLKNEIEPGKYPYQDPEEHDIFG